MASATASWPLSRWAIVVMSFLVLISFPLFTGLAFLGFGPVPYFLVVILLLGAATAATGNKWVTFANGLFLLIFAGLNAPFLVPELARPDHYPDFHLAVLIITAGVVGIVAAVATLLRTRKGAVPSPARWGTVGAMLLLLALGVIAGAAGASTTLHKVPSLGASAVAMVPDETLSLTTTVDTFVAPDVVVKEGKITKITVDNKDGFTHAFNVDALSLGPDLLGGKSTDIWIKVDKAGTYQLYCKYHSEVGADGKRVGMVGTFTVA